MVKNSWMVAVAFGVLLLALAPAAAASEGQGVNAGYDHGFYIRSADGDNLLKIWFFSQIYYEYDVNDRARDNNTFGLRRARLLLFGHAFSPKWRYMIMPEMTTAYSTTNTVTRTSVTGVDSGGDTFAFTLEDDDVDRNDRGFRLLYLWGEYAASEAFNIRFGEFKTPMHRQYTTASNVQQLPDFPLTTITEPFVPGFQTGVNIWGKLASKKFHYDLFAVNGSGLDHVNINKSMRVGTRLVYDLLGQDVPYTDGDLAYSEEPLLAVGGHFSYERADGTVVGSYAPGDDMFRASMDGVLKYKGFSFDPEGYFFYNKSQNLKHWGMTVQTGYFIIPKKFDIDLQASAIWYDGALNDQYVFGGGWDYYFYGHPVKLQMDYGLLWTRQPGDDLKDHRIRLSMEIGFF